MKVEAFSTRLKHRIGFLEVFDTENGSVCCVCISGSFPRV